VKIDGDYGYDGEWEEETEREFRAYQAKHKDLDGKPLEVDGECWRKSWGALIGKPCK
jgi:hypothetical protein